MVDLPGNDGANEGFWRFQIRDKRGNWVKMGGAVTFSTNHPNFGPITGNGTFEGGSRPGVALIRVSDDHPTLGGKVVEVPSDDFDSVKAIIPADAPGLVDAKKRDALDGIIVNAPIETPAGPELKDSITGDEVLQKIYASMGKLAKSEGRFAVGRSSKDVRAAAKETYKTVYQKLKVEYPDLAAAYPDYESYWARASNGLAAGWTTRWADSVDDIDALTKASNRIYAKEILGLKEDGLIEFYRNAVNHMRDEDLAASGYASLDRRMAWDYNSYISQYKDNGLNSTDGRYIVRARPDEVTGLIGFSQIEDEYGVVIGTDVVSQEGRKERVGGLEVQTIAPWSNDLKEFDRSGGGSPFRRVSPASQFDVYATETPVPGDEYSDFYAALGLDPKARPIPTKWDEMFGEGSFEALQNRYPSYRTIQSYFVDAGDGKVGLDMLALDRVSSRNSADPKAGDEYDTHLKMLSVIQELSGKTFMVHRGHKQDDPRIPDELETPVESINVAPKQDVQIKKTKEASEPWKKIDTWVEDRGEFTLDNNFYGTIIDFRRNFSSPVSAVDAEMLSKEHTDALKIYTGSSGYRIINNHLRYEHESDSKQVAQIESLIAAMDEMIVENGEVFENSRVFRGQYLDTPLEETDTNWIETMENLEVGDIISDPGYMSTSNDPIIAFMEFGPGRNGADWVSEDAAMSSSPVMSGSVLWMVDIPEGAKAFALPEGMGYGQGGEKEVILPRDSQLKVKGIRRVQQLNSDFEPLEGQYNYYVQADLVPQDTPGVIDVVDKTAEERAKVELPKEIAKALKDIDLSELEPSSNLSTTYQPTLAEYKAFDAVKMDVEELLEWEENVLNSYQHDDQEGNTLNDKIRESFSSKNKPNSDSLDSAISKSKFAEDVLVYRGLSVSEEVYNAFLLKKVGDIEIDSGYMSTTHNENVARGFSKSRSRPKSVIYKINVPAGTNGSRITDHTADYGEELEFLLPRETILKINKVYKDGQDTVILEAEVVAE